MGLDMIEATEMGVFSPSRLGNKCFIDDSEYANLFGSKKAKRKTTQRASEILDQFKIPKDKITDCQYLNNRLVEAQNMIEAARSKGLAPRLLNREIRPLIDIIAKIKTLLFSAKCAESQAAIEAEATTQRAIEEAAKAAENAPPETDENGTSAQSNTTKYIMYGVGGLVVVVLIAMLAKRN